MAVSPSSPGGARPAAAGEPAGVSSEHAATLCPGRALDEDVTEARLAKRKADPKLPTKEEVDTHNITHIPPRCWCSHCIRGRGVSDPHKRVVDERLFPRISFDYFFMGQHDAEDTLPLIAIKDSESRAVFSHALEAKGVNDYAIAQCCADVTSLGYRRVVFKSDQEPALVALLKAVAVKLEGVEVVPEESPVGESQANGEVENAIREIGKQIRTIKDFCEHKYGTTIHNRHPLLAWLVQHASALLTRFVVGSDGKTAFEIIRGKRYKRPLVPFGEQVHFMPLKSSGRLNKLEPRFETGVFVGIRDRSDEILVMTSTGVYKARTFKRKPEEERWDAGFLSTCVGLPWKPVPSSGEVTVLPAKVLVVPAVTTPIPEVRPDDREVGRRRLYIKKADLEEHGYTDGCPGCIAAQFGLTAQGHTESCRARIEEALKATEEGARRLIAAKVRREEVAERRGQKRLPDHAAEDEAEPAASSSRTGPAAAAGENMDVDRTGPSDEAGAEDGGRNACGSAGYLPAAGSPTPQVVLQDEPVMSGTQGSRKRKAEEDEPNDADRKRSLKMLELELELERLLVAESELPWDLAMLQKEVDELQFSYLQAGVSTGRLEAEQIRRCVRHLGGHARSVSALDSFGIGSTCEEPLVQVEGEQLCEELEAYIDDVNGGFLDPSLVRSAQAEEIAFYNSEGIYDKVPRAECTGAGLKPISVRWVDTNKGDDQSPDYRCRLVAREMRAKGVDAYFAATPPLEVLKFFFSEMVSRKTSRRGHPLKIVFIDVKKAHLKAAVSRLLYIELPEEENSPNMVGRLNFSMYGILDAAANWEKEHNDMYTSSGYVQGTAFSCSFRNEEEDADSSVHGDDFFLLGDDFAIEKFIASMRARYQITVRAILGPEEKDDKEVRMLNRYVRLVNLPDGEFQVEYEADPRHAELISKQLNLERANSVVTPGVKLKSGDLQNYSTPLPPSAASVFRSLTMRACYLAQDRADLAFSAKECARMMSQPTELGWTALKRIGRFLLGKPRVVQVFKPQCKPSALFIVASDTDHAGCLRTRKGTSGTILLHGDHCLKATSSTHTYPALSSGEDEYYGVVKAASTGLGAVAMAADFNQKKGLKIQTDSTAAKGIGTRRGLGKTRHIETRSLWVQHKIANGDLMLEKIRGTVNVAGLLTKHVDAKTCEKYMTMIGQEYRPGRLRNAKRIIGSRGPVDPTLHYLDPES